MKSVLISLFVALLVTSLPVKADKEDQLVISICNFVANDDKKRFRIKMRRTKIKLRNIYDGITCDGMSLLQFALTKNAAEIGVYITKLLPSGKLSNGQDLEWAMQNGFADSPITDAIKKRINK